MSEKQLESGYWDRDWWRAEYEKESERAKSPYR